MTGLEVASEHADPSCWAPVVQLVLYPNGDVFPCCRSQRRLGNVRDQRLRDIWDGAARPALADALRRGEFAQGCELCGAELRIEGRAGSQVELYDARATDLVGGHPGPRWPRFLDVNLSNTCNLQCIQCSGELSSSIRIHREKRAPLPSAYGEEFLEDLRLFLPHLQGMTFAGGEPFLARECYAAWELIAELRSDLPVTIITNGTQWNDRVRAALAGMRASITLSLDGITPTTYESIRIGSDLAKVLANFDHLRAYVAERGTVAAVNHCLMVQNVHEFPDLLLWADSLDVHVDVCVVRTPSSCSLTRLGADELQATAAALGERDDELRDRLRRNRATWDRELERIRAWAANAAGAGDALDTRVLVFPRQGAGAVDLAAVGAAVGGDGSGGLGEVTVGLDGRIVACSGSLEDATGIPAAELLGRHFDAVDDVALRHLGPRERFELLRADDDVRLFDVTFGRTDLRVALVAVRDEDGLAGEGRILLARR